MSHCGICGFALGPTARVAHCPDCLDVFCSMKHLSEHRELGTCPKHADGAPTPPTEEPRACVTCGDDPKAPHPIGDYWCLLAAYERVVAERNDALALDHETAQRFERVCTELSRLRSDLNQATVVVEAAAAFCDQFAHRASGFPRRDALLAAVETYRAYRSGQTEGTTPA